MENKEQSSLEKDNCVGSSTIPCSYKCCQKALADQKTKILNILKNWFIRGNHYYTQRTITTIIMRIEDLDKKKFEELK